MNKTIFIVITALLAMAMSTTAIAANITSNASGNWSATAWPNTGRTGTITTTTSSMAVTGVGTLFTTQISVGNIIKRTNNTVIGTVASVTDNTHLTLTTNAANANSGASYRSQGVGSGDNVTIPSGITVAMNSANAYCNTLSIDGGQSTFCSLTINGTNTLTVAGAVTINRPADFNVNAGTLNAASLELTGGTAANVASLNVTTGTVNITGNIAFTGTMGSLQIFNFNGAGTLNVGGTFEADGTLTAGAGTVNFAGTNQTVPPYTYNDLTVSGSGTVNLSGITVNGDLAVTGTASVTLPPTCNDITVNNINGMTLSGPMTINGTLNFILGNLYLGTYNLTLNGPVTGAAAGQCIVTNGTGGVVCNVPTSSVVAFPVGADATHYNPVTLTSDAGHTTDNFTVRATAGALNPAAPNNDQAVQITWDITEAGVGGSSVIIDLGWNSSQHGTGFSTAAASIWHYDGGSSTWQDLFGTAVAGTDPYTLSTSSAVSSFSPFAVGNSGALPVEMTSFTAESKALTAHIRWTTATEEKSYNFEIERRLINSSEYAKIGAVQAAGTSNTPRMYEFTDANLAPGKYVYRLKMNDNDGSFAYFGNAEVSIDAAPKEFSLQGNYPNPFNPSTTIEFTLPENGRATLKVYNMIGQQVATLFDGIAQAEQYNKVSFDASKLSSGMYFSVLEFNNQRLVKKMLLTK